MVDTSPYKSQTHCQETPCWATATGFTVQRQLSRWGIDTLVCYHIQDHGFLQFWRGLSPFALQLLVLVPPCSLLEPERDPSEPSIRISNRFKILVWIHTLFCTGYHELLSHALKLDWGFGVILSWAVFTVLAGDQSWKWWLQDGRRTCNCLPSSHLSWLKFIQGINGRV